MSVWRSIRHLSIVPTSSIKTLAHPEPLPSHLYGLSVKAGRLTDNVAQRMILPALDRLAVAFQAYQRETSQNDISGRDTKEEEGNQAINDEELGMNIKPTRYWDWILRWWRGQDEDEDKTADGDLKSMLTKGPLPPRGVYLYGEVGTGKTMLMNLLFQAASSRSLNCRRVHFHEFMLKTYQLMHVYDMMSNTERAARGFKHPLDAVVQFGLAGADSNRQTGLLCFDEFQMSDVGDARLIIGILTRISMEGVVLFFTSNRPPWETNRSQLQTEEFASLLYLMRQRCQFLRIDSGTDFRKQSAAKLFRQGLTDETEEIFFRMSEEGLRQLWQEESSGYDFQETTPVHLTLTLGRELHVENACGEMAHFRFRELCDSPLGTDDYTALASHFRLVLISDLVPQMSPDSRDVARRFIKLVDALYEAGSQLVMRTEVKLSELFSGTTRNGEMDLLQAEGLQFETEVGKSGVGADNRAFGIGTLYSGEDESFAFRRATSRLYEMQTPGYKAKRNRVYGMTT